MRTLLVCSESTRNFLPKYRKFKIVNSAPKKDILELMGSERKVVAIGGGAVIDTAKILSKNPIICYPTTAAGSSSTSWSVYWDGEKKCSIKRMLPKEVILDENFVKDLPSSVIMNTTFDVLSHCLDSLCSKKSTKESIGYCNEALDILRNKRNNLDLIKAGDIAGKAIEITGTNLLHSLSYPLTGHFGIDHGLALGHFLPKLQEFMGFDVSDIIGNYEVKLQFNLDLVLDKAFKYDKIYEFNKEINKEILYEKL